MENAVSKTILNVDTLLTYLNFWGTLIIGTSLQLDVITVSWHELAAHLGTVTAHLLETTRLIIRLNICVIDYFISLYDID